MTGRGRVAQVRKHWRMKTLPQTGTDKHNTKWCLRGKIINMVTRWHESRRFKSHEHIIKA